MNIRKGMIPVLVCLLSLLPAVVLAGAKGNDVSAFEWSLLTDDPGWAPRAGLQAVELKNDFFILGGRTPLDPAINPVPGASTMWSDVWKSGDMGHTWEMVRETDAEDMWPARAYFQAVTMKGRMFVLGGQNFKLIPNPDPEGPPVIPASDFFNDVWSSSDGATWTMLTDEAPWAGRAGLSAAVFRGSIYVMGGSFNDDPAIIGGPPERVYFNDVWKSSDGANWELMTEEAPWAKRAGGIAVAKGGYLYMVGGEDGFTCIPGFRCPPYYNDVWRTKDGAEWELVTAEADWPPRPGHQCLVLQNKFVLFGGFGLSEDPSNPFLPSNPMDVWVSSDGADWELVSETPWNATEPGDIKYDFDALVASGGGVGQKPAIFTFGGDRETFNFFDPVNHLRIDDDVWRFAAPGNKALSPEMTQQVVKGLRAEPNPFNPRTAIKFTLTRDADVSLAVYDLSGRLVRTLVSGTAMGTGDHEAVWDGRNRSGASVSAGVYFYRLQAGDVTVSRRMMLVK